MLYVKKAEITSHILLGSGLNLVDWLPNMKFYETGFKCFYFIFYQVNAQNSQKNPTYVTGELSIGNYFGAELHLNYIFKEEYSLKIGYPDSSEKQKPRLISIKA